MARNGLYRRGKIWWLRTDPVTKRAISTRCRDRRAAEAYRAERERYAKDPGYASAAEAQLGDWCQRLIDMKHAQRAPATVEVYQQKLGHWLRILGADCPLAAITPETVDRYVEQRRGEDVTDHTIVKELGCLAQALKLAKRSSCYPGDVAALKPLDLVTGYKPRKRALTPEELIALLATLAPYRGAFVAIAAGLGANLSEAFRLLPSDVDLDAGTVHLRGTKRPGRDRTVPILSVYRPLVERALRYLPLEPWGNIRRDLAAACHRAKIDVCTPNDLRRTHATLLKEAGVDRDIVRRLLGHTTTAMVDRVYAHPRPQALGELAEATLARSPTLHGRDTEGEPIAKPGASYPDRTGDLRFTNPEAAHPSSAKNDPSASGDADLAPLTAAGAQWGATSPSAKTLHSAAALGLALVAKGLGILPADLPCFDTPTLTAEGSP